MLSRGPGRRQLTGTASVLWRSGFPVYLIGILNEESMFVDRLTMTVGEAATALGIGRGIAYRGVNRGEIPSIRVGGRILVPIVALEKMLSAVSTNIDYDNNEECPDTSW